MNVCIYVGRVVCHYIYLLSSFREENAVPPEEKGDEVEGEEGNMEEDDEDVSRDGDWTCEVCTSALNSFDELKCKVCATLRKDADEEGEDGKGGEDDGDVVPRDGLCNVCSLTLNPFDELECSVCLLLRRGDDEEGEDGKGDEDDGDVVVLGVKVIRGKAEKKKEEKEYADLILGPLLRLGERVADMSYVLWNVKEAWRNNGGCDEREPKAMMELRALVLNADVDVKIAEDAYNLCRASYKGPQIPPNEKEQKCEDELNRRKTALRSLESLVSLQRRDDLRKGQLSSNLFNSYKLSKAAMGSIQAMEKDVRDYAGQRKDTLKWATLLNGLERSESEGATENKSKKRKEIEDGIKVKEGRAEEATKRHESELAGLKLKQGRELYDLR